MTAGLLLDTSWHDLVFFWQHNYNCFRQRWALMAHLSAETGQALSSSCRAIAQQCSQMCTPGIALLTAISFSSTAQECPNPTSTKALPQTSDSLILVQCELHPQVDIPPHSSADSSRLVPVISPESPRPFPKDDFGLFVVTRG